MKNSLLEKALNLIGEKSSYEVSGMLKAHLVRSHDLVGELFRVLSSDNPEKDKASKAVFEEYLVTCFLLMELVNAEYPSYEEDIVPILEDDLSFLLLNDSILSLMIAHRELGQLFLQFYLMYSGESEVMEEYEVCEIVQDIYAGLSVVCKRLGLDPATYF